MSYTDRITEALTNLSIYRLANLADVSLPIGATLGWQFLDGVRDDMIESLRFAKPKGPDDVRRWWLAGDAPGEIANGAEPVDVVDRWAVAGDLQAWTEDVSDFGSQSNVMESVSIALYLIASRLVFALVGYVCKLDDEG